MNIRSGAVTSLVTVNSRISTVILSYKDSLNLLCKWARKTSAPGAQGEQGGHGSVSTKHFPFLSVLALISYPSKVKAWEHLPQLPVMQAIYFPPAAILLQSGFPAVRSTQALGWDLEQSQAGSVFSAPAVSFALILGEKPQPNSQQHLLPFAARAADSPPSPTPARVRPQTSVRSKQHPPRLPLVVLGRQRCGATA